MAEWGTGSIVNIGSIAARNGGGPGSGAYSAAKAGVITLTVSGEGARPARYQGKLRERRSN
jgi:NAD(P)-dependent dehydrogenase (short-subunit alcohol dehydrogenase family)